MRKNSYKNIPICDSHMHLWREMPLSDTVNFHKWVMKEFGYETISLMSICEQPINPTRANMPNLKTMYLKKVLAPRVYAYAGLHFQGLPENDDGEFFKKQAECYYDCGYDGVKMFYPVKMYDDGFPYLHLSDKRFEKFFAFMEKKGMPITLHIGGPEVCFAETIDDVPVSQRKWYRGKREHDLHYALRDLTAMLDKFPKLKITLAHFGFITWHMDWAEAWLEKYPNLMFDLTPSLFMYFDFQEKPDEWREFFIKHADRIMYGTDTGSNTHDIIQYEPYALCHVIRGFFEEKEPIHEFEEVFYPMELPDEVLKKIYKENLMKYMGGAPKKANYKLMKDELDLEEKKEYTSEFTKENLRIMREEFLKDE